MASHKKQPKPKPKPQPKLDVRPVESILIGSVAFPASFELGGGAVAQLGDVVRAALEATGLTVDEWNALEQPWRDAAITNALKGVGVIWPAEPADDAEAPEPEGTDPQAPEGAVTEPDAADAPEPTAPQSPEDAMTQRDAADPPAAETHEMTEVTLTACLSGADYCRNVGDPHPCDRAEAIRLVAAGFATHEEFDQEAAIALLPAEA